MCELPTAYVHDTPKARKQHRCCSCGGIIESGEVYHHHHGIWDGDPCSYKVCSDCEDLRCEIDEGVHGEDLTAFTELIESAMESSDENHAMRYIAIRRKRGGKIMPWMEKRETEINAEKPSA